MRVKPSHILCCLLAILLSGALSFIGYLRFKGRLPLCGEVQRLQAYGTVREGAPFPNFLGYSRNNKEVGPTTPPGKFHIHIIGNIKNSSCLDDECGEIAMEINAKGGHLHLSANPIAGRQVGLTMLLDMERYKFVDTLLFVIGPKRETLAIYRNATTDDIPKVLKELNL